jgi:hypothetical protein
MSRLPEYVRLTEVFRAFVARSRVIALQRFLEEQLPEYATWSQSRHEEIRSIEKLADIRYPLIDTAPLQADIITSGVRRISNPYQRRRAWRSDRWRNLQPRDSAQLSRAQQGRPAWDETATVSSAVAS